MSIYKQIHKDIRKFHDIEGLHGCALFRGAGVYLMEGNVKKEPGIVQALVPPWELGFYVATAWAPHFLRKPLAETDIEYRELIEGKDALVHRPFLSYLITIQRQSDPRPTLIWPQNSDLRPMAKKVRMVYGPAVWGKYERDDDPPPSHPSRPE